MPLVLALPALALVAVMVLTGRGEVQRGGGTATVVLAGAFFPVTWLVWYVVDRRRGQRKGAASETRAGWS